MKNRTLVLPCLATLIVGFLAGTEYQKKASLEVDANDLPGLEMDLAIYTDALQSLTDPIERAYVKSKINLIKFDISKANRK